MSDSNLGTGCVLVIALIIGLLFTSWLITVGLIWLLCWCFSAWGLVFDIRLATGVWVVMLMLMQIFGGKK